MKLSKNDKDLFKRYNAKINRQLRRGVPQDLLPPKVSLRNLTVDKQTKDYAKRFLNRANQKTQFVKEGNIWVTKSEKREFIRDQKLANKIRKEYNDRFKGRQRRIISEEMQGIERNKPLFVESVKYSFRKLIRPITSFANRKEFLEYKNKLDMIISPGFFTDKDNLYKRNFIKAIINGMGDEELASQIEGLDATFVADTLITSDIDISYPYTPSAIEAKREVIKFLFGLN